MIKAIIAFMITIITVGLMGYYIRGFDGLWRMMVVVSPLAAFTGGIVYYDEIDNAGDPDPQRSRV